MVVSKQQMQGYLQRDAQYQEARQIRAELAAAASTSFGSAGLSGFADSGSFAEIAGRNTEPRLLIPAATASASATAYTCSPEDVIVDEMACVSPELQMKFNKAAAQGIVNEFPSMVMSVVKTGIEGAYIQGATEAGIDFRDALDQSKELTKNLPSGELWAYGDENDRLTGRIVGGIASPVVYGKAAQFGLRLLSWGGELLGGTLRLGEGASAAGEALEAANKGLPTGIYADSKGVYGYLPSPGSRYASEVYDFTDPSFVARQRDIRIGYLDGTDSLETAIDTMRAGGVDAETIARRVVIQRNSQKLEARALMTSDEVRVAGEKSVKDWGDPLGPTPDEMFDHFGDWNIVIQQSMRKDPAINMLLGLPRGE